MADIVEKALQWYKHFKYSWLPEQLHNPTDLIDVLTDKVDELERILTQTVGSDDDKQQLVAINNPPSWEYSAPISPHISNHIHENMKQSESISYARPKIQLKRIVLAEAESYLPPAWKPNDRKRQRKVKRRSRSCFASRKPTKRRNQNTKSPSSSVAIETVVINGTNGVSRTIVPHNSTSSLISIQSNGTETKKKTKRKLRALDAEDDDLCTIANLSEIDRNLSADECAPISRHIGQTGILSQTRKLQETTLNNETMVQTTPMENEFAASSILTHDTITDFNEETAIQAAKTDSFCTSLHLAPDHFTELQSDIEKQGTLTYLQDIQDISNDGFDLLPPHSCPTESHSSSVEIRYNFDSQSSQIMSFNTSKRSMPSSSNSDTSPTKKKTKIALKKNFNDSSSSSDQETNIPASTTRPATIPVQNPVTSTSSSPPAATRIRIQRSPSSSSDDSNGSDEIVTKRTIKRRKKPTPSNERSTILNQMKRKAQERKNSTQTVVNSVPTDNNNNSNEAKASPTKKCQFQFSDEEVDETEIKNNDGDTTESYDAETIEENNQSFSSGTIKQETKTEDDEESSPTKRSSNGHNGRKNIRKIIEDKELDSQTKLAVEAELQRRQRILEKQKEYNDILLETSNYREDQAMNPKDHRLILELDPKTNEPLIEVSPKLVQHLKKHQCDGIRFLWNNVFESIDAIKNKKQEGSGCILAHCMGLGKTLQVVSFIHTIFNYDELTKVKTCLVLCPINVALNWSNEFDYWLTDVEPPVDHYQLTTIKPNLRVVHLNYWYEHGGVMIMGYEMYRRLANGFGLRNKKIKAQVYKSLVDPGPDIIVADEGHILKNAQTALAKCLAKIQTKRRIVLTGTPLQNNLIEYYCMVSFIKPKLLGSQQEYINRFVNPIENGQHRDSSEDDVRLMKRRACVLHDLLTGFIDRKDYSLLKDYLPPKFEYIIQIRLSDLQTKLYEIYLNQNQQESNGNKKEFKSTKLFADYQYLQKIWTQPFLLYPHFIDHWKKKLDKDGDDFLDDAEDEAMFTDEDEPNGKTKKKPKKKSDDFVVNDDDDDEDDDDVDNEELSENKIDKKENGKRKRNNSTTSGESGSLIDNDDETDETNSYSEKSMSNLDDEQEEAVKSYGTRSRAGPRRSPKKPKSFSSKKNNGKSLNLDIFDTENDQLGVITSVDELNCQDDEEDSDQPWLKSMREQFWFPFLDMLPDESEFDIYLSGKFVLFKSILDKCAEIGDKILVFSRSLYTLNYIERFLQFLHDQNEENYQKQCETRRELRRMMSASNQPFEPEYISPPTRWRRDEDYFRMDGQTDVVARKRYAKAFNDEFNLRARLFLISTLAGGIGINLVGSNRVIIFDASWNPSHDTQAIFRSYRFGQKKPVYIYRFLAHGTMEEKIYQRQVVKQSLAQRVIDDHQLDRHFTESDIKELYKFAPESLPEDRPTNKADFEYPIPKDHLLLDLLYDHHRWIHSYHSHDSLLENKLEEGLSNEERRRALEEYEILKHSPHLREFPSHRFEQQQQPSALSPMVRLPSLEKLYLDFLRSMPTDEQLSDYTKMLQCAFELGLGNTMVETRKPPLTTATDIYTVDSEESE